MKLKKSAAVAFLFFIFVFAANQAAAALEVPPLTSPVIDNAKIMSETKRAELEEYLLALDKNSSAQIAVLTIKALNGADLEGYAIQVCREWGLGQKEDSKGVLLLVSVEEKKIRIETGYGAEGDLTDAKCGMIIRNVIAPSFQNNDYSTGIINGTKAIASLIAPNEENTVRIEKDSEPDFGATLAMLIFFALYFIIFTGSLSTKFRALRWLPWAQFFVNNANRPHTTTHYNTYNSFGSGGFPSGSSFGGSSGGGFRGGGGGFGGGGASGGW